MSWYTSGMYYARSMTMPYRYIRRRIINARRRNNTCKSGQCTGVQHDRIYLKYRGGKILCTTNDGVRVYMTAYYEIKIARRRNICNAETKTFKTALLSTLSVEVSEVVVVVKCVSKPRKLVMYNSVPWTKKRLRTTGLQVLFPSFLCNDCSAIEQHYSRCSRRLY